jgi:hypothetical protein
MDLEYGLLVAGLILGGFVFFFIIGKIGQRLMISHDRQLAESDSCATLSNTASSGPQGNDSCHENYAVDIRE